MTPSRKPGALERAEQLFVADRLIEAQAQCEAALRRRRNDVDALTMLARIATRQERIDDALSLLERAGRIRPADPAIGLMRARLLLAQDRIDDALAIYEGMLRRRPKLAAAAAGRAAVLDQVGRGDESLEQLESFVAGGLEDPEVAMIYAAQRSRRGEHDRAIEVASRNLDKPAGPLIGSGLRFNLGQALEKAGRHDEAFAAYTAANELIRRPFDPAAVRDRFDRLIEVCTKTALDALPHAAGSTDLPVLVIGMPRSGSTLVERVIAAHPRAAGVGEDVVLWELTRSLGERIGSVAAYPECLADLEQQECDTLSGLYVSHLLELAPGVERVVDKQLGNDESLGLAQLIVPGARVIHCLRDPLDNCLSCYAMPLETKRHPYSTDLAAIGFVYRERLRLMDHWERTLEMPILTVRYEEMVDDQETTSRRIIEFCGLPWDDACLRFHETKDRSRTLSFDQVRRPIYRSSMRRAAPFEKHLGPLRQALGQI